MNVMNTTTNPLANQAEQLARREIREARRPLEPHQWRNLAYAMQMGLETRPLVGVIGTRINGEARLAAAFGPEKEQGR